MFSTGGSGQFFHGKLLGYGNHCNYKFAGFKFSYQCLDNSIRINVYFQDCFGAIVSPISAMVVFMDFIMNAGFFYDKDNGCYGRWYRNIRWSVRIIWDYLGLTQSGWLVQRNNPGKAVLTGNRV